jgi:REP element-mobilizing transposase RayT
LNEGSFVAKETGMPRLARLDAPGILHHVIIRGIERKTIFRDKADQEGFVDRLSNLIPETQTSCYAWVLMTNHAHFLFRSGPLGLAGLMQRLLTGHAVSFNRRHKRHGQLFQNRYKSIICQEDAYLKELVRYIHLNPLRAGLVEGLNALNDYAFCGHRSLVGKGACDWQDDAYVLGCFAKNKTTARNRYCAYVKAGIDMGRRPELVGGGLIRSLGGWSEVKKLRLKGMDRIKGDERILGDSDFVMSVLSQADEQFERRYELKRLGYDMSRVADTVARIYSMDKDDIFLKGRQKLRSDARGLFCYWCSAELGLPLTDLARKLVMTVSGVGYAVRRGEKIVKQHQYRLTDKDS